jgi:hypothetical protein
MKRQNELLKKQINKLSYNQKFEIYNILVKSNQKFSENKNGIFFNLKYLNQSTIDSIKEFLNYSEQIQKDVYYDTEDKDIRTHNEESLHTQYNKYNENIEKKDSLDTEEFVLYNNNEYSNITSTHSNNNEEEEDENIDDVITIQEENDEGDTEVTEIYNQEIHENIDEQDDQENETISVEYEIEEDIAMEDFTEKESTKNKFIFKNYMNKLHLQSKEMNVKLYNKTKQDTSTNIIQNILQQSTSTINNKLTGSKSRIYNVCKNIHKSNEYC